MKWIRTAIGAVIAILSIGIISISVYKLTQSSEVIKEISFEIDFDEATWEGTYYPISVYNEILEYAVTDNYRVTNIVSGYVNNSEIDDLTMDIGPTGMMFFFGNIDGNISIGYEIGPDGFLYNSGELIEDDINIKFVFDVPQPPQITGITAAFILLIPLVFVGGVVLFYYKPLKKD